MEKHSINHGNQSQVSYPVVAYRVLDCNIYYSLFSGKTHLYSKGTANTVTLSELLNKQKPVCEIMVQ